MSRKKAMKIWRKQWRRAITTLQRNLNAITPQMAKDLVWNVTPADSAICVEAMLFTIVGEMEEWPEAWDHHHYWSHDRPGFSRCSCGVCPHGHEALRSGPPYPRGVCVECHELRQAVRMAQDLVDMMEGIGRGPSGRVLTFDDAFALVTKQGLSREATEILAESILEMGPPQGTGW